MSLDAGSCDKCIDDGASPLLCALHQLRFSLDSLVPLGKGRHQRFADCPQEKPRPARDGAGPVLAKARSGWAHVNWDRHERTAGGWRSAPNQPASFP
jgi:hypothetical protein